MISTAPKITNAGRALEARAIGGETIAFTRFAIGDGSITDLDPADLTELVSQRLTFKIKEIDKSQNGYIKITGAFVSEDIEQSFEWRELGLFCKGEDDVEVLFAYSNDGNNAGVLRAGEDDVISEQIVSLTIAIENAKNITAVLSESVLYAKKSELENETFARENADEELRAEIDKKSNLTYCICETAEHTNVKLATVSAGAFELEEGVSVDVKFTYSNTANAPRLNVANTGAKAIKPYGTTAPSKYLWNPGAIVRFIYDGTYWVMQNDIGVGILPRLDITAAAGTTVTVTNGSNAFSKTSDGVASFELPYFGEWAITAGNYIKTFNVDTAKVYKIQALPLSEATWAQISEISEAGKAPDMWSIGDEKDIIVGEETLTLVIVDFNHDDKSDGSGKALITFGLKNLMTARRKMNSARTNVGGFTGSELYAWLQGELLSSLPEDLQSVIKFVDKKTSAGNASTTINIDSMKLFLFSEIEIFGHFNFSVEGEGAHYPYFATTTQRIKYLSNGTGANAAWWGRSPTANDSTHFCLAYTTGTSYVTSYDNYADNLRGVCFGFCV